MAVAESLTNLVFAPISCLEVDFISILYISTIILIIRFELIYFQNI